MEKMRSSEEAANVHSQTGLSPHQPQPFPLIPWAGQAQQPARIPPEGDQRLSLGSTWQGWVGLALYPPVPLVRGGSVLLTQLRQESW